MVLLVNCPPPTERVHHTEPNTKAYFGQEELGKGTLYISESVLCWVSGEGEGFSLQYPSIYIHAVSTDKNNFPEPCLFLMIDGKISLEKKQLTDAMGLLSVDEKEEEEDDDEEEEDSMKELHFVPENRMMLDVMFRALLDCQALNPDPEDEEDDEECEFNIPIYSANGAAHEDIEYDEEDEDDSEMGQDQFEDAE